MEKEDGKGDNIEDGVERPTSTQTNIEELLASQEKEQRSVLDLKGKIFELLECFDADNDAMIKDLMVPRLGLRDWG